jgi:hypothetical protein
MVLTFSLFKNDINNFSNEDNYKNNEKFLNFYNFLDFYKDIINDDNKKPVFIQSTKNKKTQNNQLSKGYKYFKINRENEEEHKKTWSIKNFVKDNEKNIIFIKTTLNKISDESYEIICDELLNEIYKMNYDESIFEILANEIINKCIYENKYRKLYIHLCDKLWNDIEFHKKIFFIDIDDNNKFFYINKNTEEKSEYFDSEEEIYNFIYKNNNFKKYFINNLKNIIFNFDTSYFIMDNLSEEEVSKKKKYYLSIFDIVNILFIEKHITIDIINILVIKLLHLHEPFEIIQSLEYEALYNLVKSLSAFSYNFNESFDFYKEIINYNKQILESTNLSKRNMFFLNEIIDLLNKILTTNNKQKWSGKTNEIIDNKKNILDYFKNNNFKMCKDIIKNNNDKSSIINSLLIKTLEFKNISSDIINFFNELNLKEVEKEFYNICNNIESLMMDISNANIKCIKLFNELNINKKNNVLFLLENIDESSSDED